MLSPVETDYLIYRFLLESGYVHAAFMFGHESGIVSAGIADKSVPVGALLTLLEKGMQLLDIEIHMDTNGRLHICEQPLSLFQPHRCSIKNLRTKGSDFDTYDEVTKPVEPSQQLSSGALPEENDLMRPIAVTRRYAGETAQAAEELLAALAKNTTQHSDNNIKEFVIEQKGAFPASGDLINISPSMLELTPKQLELTTKEEQYIREILKRIYSSGIGLATNKTADRDPTATEKGNSPEAMGHMASQTLKDINKDVRLVAQNTFDSLLQAVQRPTDMTVTKQYIELPVKYQEILDSISSQEIGMKGSLVERCITLTDAGILVIEIGNSRGKEQTRSNRSSKSSGIDMSFVSYTMLVSSSTGGFLTSSMVATAAAHAVINNLVYMIVGFSDGMILVCTCNSSLNISAVWATYPFGYLTIKQIKFSNAKRYIAIIGDTTRPFVMELDTYKSIPLNQQVPSRSTTDLSKMCNEILVHITKEKDLDLSSNLAFWPLCTNNFHPNFNENNIIRKQCADLCWVTENSFIVLSDGSLIVISIQLDGKGLLLNGFYQCPLQKTKWIIWVPEAKVLAVIAENSIAYYSLNITKPETPSSLEKIKLRPLSDIMQFSGEYFSEVFEYPKHIVITTISGQVYGINKSSPTSLAWDTKLSGQPVCVRLASINDWFFVGIDTGGLVIINDSGHVLGVLSIFNGEACKAVSGLTSTVLYGSTSMLCILSDVY